MASNSKGGAIAGSFGKRFVNRVWSSSYRFSTLTSRGVVQVSSYDKNVDEHVRPSVVPDEVINGQSDKYWAPHPNTGVFGPAEPAIGSTAAAGDHGAARNKGSSVLDQKVWFRPLEDVEKPRCD
ncbi:late embryogenesis abundant protein At5g17165-like [Typha angustifolia]|uniref:late embryogenesis abundant protein At5g17165-like n=1 Tax=Typha angustifolia TaxID=59011 RepID=UPI003C2CEDBB